MSLRRNVAYQDTMLVMGDPLDYEVTVLHWPFAVVQSRTFAILVPPLSSAN
jgi:hypothetical protein